MSVFGDREPVEATERKRLTAAQKAHSGTLPGSSTKTAALSATADSMVARPTYPESSSTMIQLTSSGTSKRSSRPATAPITVAAPLPPRKSNQTG